MSAVLRRAALSILVALPFSLASGVHAAPLAYDESVDGDLTHITVQMQTLALDFGVNTVSGSAFVTFPAAGPAESDSDPIKFSLPTGGLLESITYSFSTEALDGTTTLLFSTSLLELPSVTQLGSQDVDLLGTSPVDLFASLLPLSGPEYRITHGNAANGTFPIGGSWTYTFTFTVVPAVVPEPATAMLLAAGLLGLGLRRRRDMIETGAGKNAV